MWNTSQGPDIPSGLRHARRALSIDELRRLLDAAKDGPVVLGMPGAARAMLYKLAAETGLRDRELSKLTAVSFMLDGQQPVVRVRAAYSKRRREDELPLRLDTATQLRDYLSGKASGEKAFDMPSGRLAAMIRRDLKAAGIEYVDASGLYADFHSLRHTCGSLLAAAGAHPKVAQMIMRHSDINMTMSRYTHVLADQAKAAVAALPKL